MTPYDSGLVLPMVGDPLSASGFGSGPGRMILAPDLRVTAAYQETASVGNSPTALRNIWQIAEQASYTIPRPQRASPDANRFLSLECSTCHRLEVARRSEVADLARYTNRPGSG